MRRGRVGVNGGASYETFNWMKLRGGVYIVEE